MLNDLVADARRPNKGLAMITIDFINGFGPVPRQPILSTIRQ
jgi:hypothetical protein